MSKPRDSFDAAPPRDPQNVTRLDLHIQVFSEEGAANTYNDSYEFHRPDASGDSEYLSGALRPHLTPTEKGQIKKILDRLIAKANA